MADGIFLCYYNLTRCNRILLKAGFIVPNTLFSTYKQEENQVTSSILAVFERLSFALVERILQSLCEEPESSLLSFDNQPQGKSSIPDGRIRASFAYWIETKIVSASVTIDQIKRHLEAIENDTGVERKRLLVLTPDEKKPKALAQLDDRRVAWTNFDNFVETIQSIVKQDDEWLTSKQIIPNEYERGLLRELVHFFDTKGLVKASDDRVLVVAAQKKLALAEYLNHSVYICQPNRSFQSSSYMAFYVEGKIYHKVPKILEAIESISKEEIPIRTDLSETTRKRLLVLIENLEQEQSERLNERLKIVFLSSPDSHDTLTLPHAIENDFAPNGKKLAFVQGQRYISLTRLRKAPQTTSQLLPTQVIK